MLVGYSPKDFIAVVDGVPVVDPADTDDAFMAELDEDRSRSVTGLYGAGGNEFESRTSGTFTIKVKGKSPDNDRFTQIFRARRQVTIQFVNKASNTERAFTKGSNGVVRSFSGVGGGLSQPDRTWVFGSPEMEALPGGNRLI